MTKLEYLNNCKGYGTNCIDCGKDNHPYTITSELWSKYVSRGERGECICILCMEDRIGRSLILSDFSDHLINKGVFGFKAKVYCSVGKSSPGVE